MSKPSFWRITLDTNPDFCNLNCIMCEDHSPYSESTAERKKNKKLRPFMKPELLERTIRDAAKMGITEVIPSTMGEPLIYPHFDLFLNLCRELNLSLNLTTNGTFPAPKNYQNVEYWAQRIVPVASDVKISWNGATEATQQRIMLGTTLSAQVENAKRFIEVRDSLVDTNYCSITMQLTFMKSNLEEIIDMLELALELGFDRLKGHHLWAHFPEIEAENLRNDMAFALRWNEISRLCHERVEEYNLTAKRTFRLDNFFELNLEDLADIAPQGACPFLGRELWVDPTGRLNVCCAPDQQRKTLGDFGRVADTPLAELVEREDYKRLTQTYKQNELCRSCNMRRPA